MLSALKIEELLPATFTAPGLSEAEFLELCAKFPDAQVEYTSDGTVVVMPPTDPRSSERGMQIAYQLMQWSGRSKRGHVTGPDGGFFFRDGSRRAPDAAWFSEAGWAAAEKTLHGDERFPVFAPDFVVEVRSRHDRIRVLREKMEQYIANGVQVGWLIDPQQRNVTIYRPGRAPELLENPSTVTGDGPISGFVLKLDRIFDPA